MFRLSKVRLWARALTQTLVAAMIAGVAIVVPSILNQAESAQAAMWPEYSIDMSKFNAGRIITDELFFDSNSMTVAQIQSFLNEKVPTCRAGYTCLRSFAERTYDVPANPMCSKFVGGARDTAAIVIWKTAQACGISPKVILVTLEKEQGLVSDSWPSAYQYKYAMGADCPDSGDGCGLTAGFVKQVYRGTYMMKRYTSPPGTGPGTNYETNFGDMKKVGTWQNVQYGISATCGTKRVYISNQATHVLYVYTPYTPNQAALNAGWGTAACGAYGNRNFFRYYFMWFGDPNGIPPSMSVAPTQTGTAVGLEKVGTVLSATSGAWKGNPAPALSYQWYSCPAPVTTLASSIPSGCAPIANAKTVNYALTQADVGRYVASRVSVQNGAGSTMRLTASTAQVYQAPVVTTAPTISGLAVAGSPVTVSNGAWTAAPSPRFSYQWSLCATADPRSCKAIPKATAATYTALSTHVGKFYRVAVTAANISAVTAVTPVLTQVLAAPTVAVAPTLAGPANIGSIITIQPGQWNALPSATWTYQFLSCAASVARGSSAAPANCTPLAAASPTNTLIVDASQRGRFIVGSVTATNSVAPSTYFTASSAAVGDDPGLSMISGTLTQGSVLTATSGTWTPARTSIRLSTTGAKHNGYSIKGVQQALRAVGLGTPLTNVYDARTIRDVKKFQQLRKVRLADGEVGAVTWAKMLKITVPATSSFTYQWLRCTSSIQVTSAAAPSNCVPIANAVAPTYTLTADDAAKYIMVAVTGSGVSSVAKTRWSLTTAVVG
jgi:hypothetical protein